MSYIVPRQSLDRIRQVLSAGAERCQVCGRSVDAQAPRLRFRGAWVHADCAGYRSRSRRVA